MYDIIHRCCAYQSVCITTLALQIMPTQNVCDAPINSVELQLYLTGNYRCGAVQWFIGHGVRQCHRDASSTATRMSPMCTQQE